MLVCDFQYVPNNLIFTVDLSAPSTFARISSNRFTLIYNSVCIRKHHHHHHNNKQKKPMSEVSRLYLPIRARTILFFRMNVSVQMIFEMETKSHQPTHSFKILISIFHYVIFSGSGMDKILLWLLLSAAVYFHFSQNIFQLFIFHLASHNAIFSVICKCSTFPGWPHFFSVHVFDVKWYINHNEIQIKRTLSEMRKR